MFHLISLQWHSCRYEALSYVWGSKDNTVQVLVQSQLLDQGFIPITRNLDVALRHLRHRHESRLVWIDALCINQSNKVEKGSQVGMMGRIFSLARSVIAWLGPEENNSNYALEIMRYWACHVDVDYDSYTMRPSEQSSDFTWGNPDIRLPYQLGELQPVCALLERPYFSRTWIRQEISLATHAVIQCGQEEITWKDFQRAVFCLRWKGFFVSAMGGTRFADLKKKTNAAFDVCATIKGYLSFSYLRIDLRDAQCQDPRDMIYATLSLLKNKDQRLGIESDYARSVEELYVDVFRRVVTGRHSLELLETCELSSKILDIPSWVPDWSSRLKYKDKLMSKWSACGWISAQATMDGGNSIRVPGVMASQIECVTEIDMDEYDGQYYDLLRGLRKLRPSVEALAAQNESSLSCIQKYCHALVGDVFFESYMPPQVGKPKLEECMEILDLVWSTSGTWNELRDSKTLPVEIFLENCESNMFGRRFFQGSNQYIGFAPAGTEPGDIVCVLLGCRFPVVLRPSLEAGLSPTWQVMGVCHSPGLMMGEAIYGSKLPSHYRPVKPLEGPSEYVLYDPKTQTLKTEPAEILMEMGIKVENHPEDSSLIEVLPETLRAAGVALQEFTLI
ncbi:HET-domain-containing protein [Cucurbitaria berberidis CBS 394.84]|uniref:HET-domain-containing protein n=1 Tax=Cucurbitaria berberidis CBS 394.84 TaxID=1168544 RepID=A0A9P4LA99_9PLEO|nr:HET-domain-containing protein [Cucurbitaria berberidis CBS 394.84]KAF1848166.1 HET-domain-containing protein [Cucurbitaria berberidis CBS 394.84]